MTKELEPYDAFPNAPGLSKELGLTRRADGKAPPQFNEKGWRWCSICNAHSVPREDCDTCAVGSYVRSHKKKEQAR